MLKNILKISVAATAISAATSSIAQDTNDYVTLMMDTTGSMGVMRTDGLTRCEKAKEMIEDDLKKAILNGKNVKVVGFDSNVHDVSGGFVNTTGMNPWGGPGKAVYDDLVQKVNALQCNGGTALGDAVCEVIDELYQVNPGTNRPIIGLYTDAAEWASDPNVCGGPVPDYVFQKILPKVFSNSPNVHINTSILTTAGGNVSFSVSGEAIIANSLEDQPVASMLQGFSAAQDEINALQSLSQFTGGNFHVVADDDPCDTGCSALSDSDDPWSGGGFGR